jgi:eukaryotic-like serine/threonine-protein kinase
MDENGSHLGKYQILREIGRGGMGVVYLAEDRNLKREVALKTLRPMLGSDRKHWERFQREGQAVGSLNHPNIVHINALEIIDDQILIEMPYFSRGSVRDLIDCGTPLREVVRILRDVLLALECCHNAGIVHRDVKPNNLLLADSGRIRIGRTLRRPVSAERRCPSRDEGSILSSQCQSGL